MLIIEMIDLVSIITSAIALILILWNFKNKSFHDNHGLFAIFFITLFLIYNILLFIEWSDITKGLDELENIIGALLPMGWAILLYSFVQSMSKDQIKKSKQKFSAAFNQTLSFMCLLDLDGKIIEANETSLKIINGNNSNATGEFLWDTKCWIHSPELQENLKESIRKAANGELVRFEITHQPDSGNVIYIDFSIKPVLNNRGEINMLITEGRDISQLKLAIEEKNKLDAQLQQAHKMDAIGNLAGGIAHDFNNILSGIFGYTELAQMECSPDSQIYKDLNEVIASSQRAKDLVSQILTFSRQSDAVRTPVIPATAIKESIKMLRPIIPSNIEIHFHLDEINGFINANPTQLSQIFINLATNSLHAIGDKNGDLTISLREIIFQEEDLKDKLEANIGHYVQISFSDTGSGIPKKIKDRIFEPYFTTKEEGKGTGLGLSIVHGIIKSYGGFITVYSEPSRGTTINIFLPLSSEDESIKTTENTDVEISADCKRILFIDDEQLIVDLNKTRLERFGHKITATTSSIDALNIFKMNTKQFDVVITDQTMPEMTGDKLAIEILKLRPDIPIILCTGFSSTIQKEKALAIGIKEFVLKPVSNQQMLNLINKVCSKI